MLTRFESCDPALAPASELLAEMEGELNRVYETFSRLDNPKVSLDHLRPPHGSYLVGRRQGDVVAGGGVRQLTDDVAEIKRMYVRPAARSQGLAGELLLALEETARSMGYGAVRLDTGPKQIHALALYRRAGYVEIEPYNDNPFACFWGEKVLRAP